MTPLLWTLVQAACLLFSIIVFFWTRRIRRRAAAIVKDVDEAAAKLESTRAEVLSLIAQVRGSVMDSARLKHLIKMASDGSKDALIASLLDADDPRAAIDHHMVTSRQI